MRPINRRNFITGVAAVTAAGMGGISRLARAQAASPIAIQLYTVREKSRADFKGTLRRVTAIGYRNFEFAGYGDLRAPQLNQFLNERGATCCGTHEGFRNFLAGPEKVIEFNKAIGNPYVVVPSMPTDLRRGGVDVIRGFARDLNELGHKVKQAGMQLCYHNHSFEFESIGRGQTIWDILFAAADPDLVKAEVDVAWVHNAGIDPVEHLNKWGSRIKLLHMKDMDEKKTLVPVGTGAIDMKSVVRKAKEIGVEWYVVEQDRPRPGQDIMDEISISYRNLAALLV